MGNHLHKMTAVSKLLLLFILSNIHNQTQGKKYLTELKDFQPTIGAATVEKKAEAKETENVNSQEPKSEPTKEETKKEEKCEEETGFFNWIKSFFVDKCQDNAGEEKAKKDEFEAVEHTSNNTDTKGGK